MCVQEVQACVYVCPLSIESLLNVPTEDARGQETYWDSVFVCIAEGEVYYQM